MKTKIVFLQNSNHKIDFFKEVNDCYKNDHIKLLCYSSFASFLTTEKNCCISAYNFLYFPNNFVTKSNLDYPIVSKNVFIMYFGNANVSHARKTILRRNSSESRFIYLSIYFLKLLSTMYFFTISKIKTY